MIKLNEVIPMKRSRFGGWTFCTNMTPEMTVMFRRRAEEKGVDIKLSMQAVNTQGYFEPRLIGIYMRDWNTYRNLVLDITAEALSVGRYLHSIHPVR